MKSNFTIITKRNNGKKILFLLMFMFVAIFASAQEGDLPWEGGIQWFIDFMTGSTARLIFIALLALLGITSAVVGGEVIKTKGFWIIVGFSIAFGAPGLAGLFMEK